MSYDTDGLKFQKGKLFSRILATTVFLFLIVVIHQWSLDRSFSLAVLARLVGILFILSGVLWTVGYGVDFLLRKWFHDD